MTTVRAQPQDKTTIVPVGNHACPDQIHIWWALGGGGENPGGSVHLKCQRDASMYKFPRALNPAAEAGAAAAPATFADSIEAKRW